MLPPTLNQFFRTIGGAVGVSMMGVPLQRYINSAKDPVSSRAQLQARLQADFVVFVLWAALILAIAIAILVGARLAEKEMGPAAVAGPAA